MAIWQARSGETKKTFLSPSSLLSDHNATCLQFGCRCCPGCGLAVKESKQEIK